MADRLLIHYDPDNADNATWSLVNSNGELVSMIANGSLEDASQLAAKHKTIVLLDSKSIHLTRIKLPIKNHQKLIRALPFALEEQIADDIDELHFIATPADNEGSVAVAAIRHDTLKNLLQRFNAASIDPIAILPDALCLAANDQQWAVLLDDEQATLQLSKYDGTKIDLENLPFLLQSLTGNESLALPKKLLLFSTEDQETDSLSSKITEDIDIVQLSYNTHPIVVYCGQYQHALPTNLLQGDYKPASKGGMQWRRWRFAASLAAFWLVLTLGFSSFQQSQLQNKNEKLRVQIDKIYKTTFPESKKIVNARVQMEQKLDELRGRGNSSATASMMSLLSASATALASEKNITLQVINYRNQKIDLELTSTKLETIESLNSKLNSGEIDAKIISSSSEKDQVKGNIRIEKTAS